MPFTREQFFEVFAAYNTALWPLHVVAYSLGLIAVGLCFVGFRTATATISAILASMWLVNGVAYHWAFFSEINGAARIFGFLFVVQRRLTLQVRHQLCPGPPWDRDTATSRLRRDAACAG
jgi:hypothetical protein